MTRHRTRTAYGDLVRSFDHQRLSRLPAYQALRQALSHISSQARRKAVDATRVIPILLA